MAVGYLSMITDNMIQYVFGSYVLFGLFLLLAVTVMLFKMNLGVDAIVVILFPLTLIMALSSTGLITEWVSAAIVLIAGLVLGLAIYRLWRR